MITIANITENVFTQKNVCLCSVTSDFPKIVKNQLSLGIYDTSYSIEISAVENFIVELGNILVNTLIEIESSMGALTQKLIECEYKNYFLIQMGNRFVVVLPKKFPSLQNRIFHNDVLKFDFQEIKSNQIMLLGNYPYNISKQIVFLILENCEKITDLVGIFQKEVVCLFDILTTVFDPPPKVVSGIISMKRCETPLAPYKNLKIVLKAAFNQRRKTLNNTLNYTLKGLQFKDTTY